MIRAVIESNQARNSKTTFVGVRLQPYMGRKFGIDT